MKILLAGGGSGGHFYPLIAVAEEINKIVALEHIIDAKLYYMADSPYDKLSLSENNIEYREIPAGKLRKYFSILNFFDLFKTFFGVINALVKIYSIYPDVIFSKGGYASFPVIFAGRVLGIPVVIHESDSLPGRVNLWASKFAKKIAVSYEEAGRFFPPERTAWVGQPIRSDLKNTVKEGTFEYLKLDPTMPVILILGGSQGAAALNETILDILPELLEKYQIIHQVGRRNLAEMEIRSKFILKNNPNADRYRIFPFLHKLALKMSAGAATLIISRAGSGIFEIASWGVPSIIIPIKKEVSRDQTSNAFNYARAGGCIVIEEPNLTPHLLLAEINELMADQKRRESMSEKAKIFSRPDAAQKIARELISIALSHEK